MMSKTSFNLIMLVMLLLAGCITEVDDSLPHSALTDIEVGVAVDLVASPSHPTSFVTDKPLVAGSKVAVIGVDPSAQWLLVMDGEQIGWMPTFYSRTNIGRLAAPITIDPLPASCTQYLDMAADVAEPWGRARGDAVLVQGSILRPNVGDAFDAATLELVIEGAGTVTAADYVHVLLTRSQAVVLFGFAVEGLDRDSQITLELDDVGDEELVYQAAFFANNCPEDVAPSADGFTDSLPIGVFKRSLSKPTPELPSPTPTPYTPTAGPSTPEQETPNVTSTPVNPITPTATPTPTPIRITSGPPRSQSQLADEIEETLRQWDIIHHEVDYSLDPTDLPLVLTGEALEQQRNTLQRLRDDNCYWIFEDLAPAEVRAIVEVGPDEVRVDARKHWDGDYYCDGRYQDKYSFDDPFFVRYTMIRTDVWRVASKEVIEEDEVVNGSSGSSGSQRATPRPSVDQTLVDSMMQQSRRSGVGLDHPQAAADFAENLVRRLPQFRLTNIGVTERAMRDALQRSDVGDRVNCVVDEVWGEWSDVARQRGVNADTADPSGMNFSPFRQLVIRLIQDRQGTLSDAEQHALHNYFTRSESANAWRNEADGIIGAVNRESFQWP